MDINGAKALRDRLGPNGADEAPPQAVDANIPESAPPVYHWVGVPKVAVTSSREVEEPPAQSGSLFRRLGLSFR